MNLTPAPTSAELGGSLLYYPLVGLMVGLTLQGLAILLPGNAGSLPAAIVLAAWVLLTGALHIDGLADSADAWAGGLGNAERSLAIMKDPNCGPVGVVAVVLVVLLKFAALDSTLIRQDALALLLAPTLGRSAAVLLFLTTPYVRPGGLGATLAESLPRKVAAGVLAAVFALVILVAGYRGLWVVASSAVIFWFLRNLMTKRIGGTTGDTAGALIELTECAVLAVALVV